MATTHTVSRNDGTAPKRGDLAIHVKVQHDYYIGGGAREYTTVRVGVVTSVSRTGEVLAAHWPFSNTETERRATPTKTLVGGAIHTVPATIVNVDAVLSEYRSHTWPGHDTQIMPYADNAEARAIIASHRL